MHTIGRSQFFSPFYYLHCIIFSCNIELGSRSDLAEHFSAEHSNAYSSLFSDSTDLEPELKLRSFQTLKCSICDFISLDPKMVNKNYYSEVP
jgi:hypothetical protein